MSPSVLARFRHTFAGGILRTTREKWFDGGLFAVALLYQFFLGKPSSFWEAVTPFVWLLCLILAVHVVLATVGVWRGITEQPRVREVESPILLPNAGKRKTVIEEPRPPYFRPKLLGIAAISLMLLSLPSYFFDVVLLLACVTYVYLVPTAELMECKKRAFFIEAVGPQILYNVEIVLKDNKSGGTYSQIYPELDPGPRPSETYFWFTPSSPWDEDYTAKVAARGSRSSQDLILSSVHHQPQFATQIILDDNKNPTVSCRDSLLPKSYTLAAKEHRTCADLMKLVGDVPSKLDVYSYQRADGNLTIRKTRTLPSPSELDQNSDDRHLTEYQRQIVEPILKRYSRSRLLIYFAGGQKSKAYAEEFHKMFIAGGWKVDGPLMVPVGDERIIDIQMSVNYQENWDKYNPKPHDVLNAFEKAGIKQRSTLTSDPNVPNELTVLWIGPRSPNDVRPNQCSPVAMKPAEGQPQTCEMIAETDRECPIPSK